MFTAFNTWVCLVRKRWSRWFSFRVLEVGWGWLSSFLDLPCLLRVDGKDRACRRAAPASDRKGKPGPRAVLVACWRAGSCCVPARVPREPAPLPPQTPLDRSSWAPGLTLPAPPPRIKRSARCRSSRPRCSLPSRSPAAAAPAYRATRSTASRAARRSGRSGGAEGRAACSCAHLCACACAVCGYDCLAPRPGPSCPG